MAFGSKQNSAALQISVDRLAAVAGAPGGASLLATNAVASPVRQRPRGELQPDPSRIRPRQLEETPEDRKRRLAAKTVNFTATTIARIVIIAAAGLWAWEQYQYTGQIHRGVAVGILVMFGDLGRVIMKASEPGTK